MEPQTRDGATYDHARDGMRLNAQQERVWNVMRDGRWRSLIDIADITGDGEASISARLRDFRKARCGGYDVQRRHVAEGYFEYRLVVPAGGSGAMQ